MSGGRWDYKNDYVCDEIFGWNCYPQYGIGNKEQVENAKLARKIDPLGDRLLSEMTYDLFCLLHSRDWLLSGDTGDDTYKADVEAFKKKWFKRGVSTLLKEEIDERVSTLHRELIEEFKPFLAEKEQGD